LFLLESWRSPSSPLSHMSLLRLREKVDAPQPVERGAF
jgi:hypothetical protein